VLKALSPLVLFVFTVSTMVTTDVARDMLGPQSADPNFNPSIARPAYDKRHPRVLFDEAHHNADTMFGRYKPFVDLMTSDGYKLVPGKEGFSKKTLKGYEVLVIVNASGPPGKRDERAFTGEECDAVQDWVSTGGALLLVTDSAPFSNAVSSLSKRFDVDLAKGHTIDKTHHSKESGDETELSFTRDDGLIQEHSITRGRDATERINRILTFTGTSVKGPAGSVAFLKLADTAMDVLPPDPNPTSRALEEGAPNYKTLSAADRAQGIALQHGKGRVVVLGEAAMLSAEVTTRGFRFGMSVTDTDNRQLALNIMHWLSGLLR
jgi:hypothetical protein